jgi:receptor protein-tyrosine kinase
MPGEGKTMTSVNLAIALALAGQRVVLADGDLRRPMIATVFGIGTNPRGFADVLLGRADPEEALTSAPGHGDRLRLLLSSPDQAQLIDLLDPERVERALTELRLVADVVVIDSPPITEVADALALADEAEVVLVAVRLGRTRRDRLDELRRMLAQRGIAPAGFVVTTRKARRGEGYYYGAADGEGMPPPRGAAVVDHAVRRPRSHGPRRKKPAPSLLGHEGKPDEF